MINSMIIIMLILMIILILTLACHTNSLSIFCAHDQGVGGQAIDPFQQGYGGVQDKHNNQSATNRIVVGHQVQILREAINNFLELG